jgi:hypothetical protein
MAKLPKSIIKKYGISKKAWAVFRGNKTSSKRTRGIKMAKKKHYSNKNGNKGFMGKAIQVLVGAGVAVLYEVFVSPYIPISGMIKNLVEMIIGIFLASNKKMPMIVRAGGTALAIVNAYELIAPYVQGMVRRR